MSSNIYDRSNYSIDTLSMFELVSSYFTNVFYNRLHSRAIDMKNDGTVPSITAGYKLTLNLLIKGLTKPVYYSRTIKDIHDYMTKMTKYTTISYTMCVNKIVAEFIPTDYCSALNINQKTSILKSVINNINNTVIKKIVSHHLTSIIDNRTPDNACIIKEAIIDTMLWERDVMYQKFISAQTKGNKQVITSEMKDKIEMELKSHIEEKFELRKTINTLKLIIVKNSQRDQEQKELIAELQNELQSVKESLITTTEKPKRKPRAPRKTAAAKSKTTRQKKYEEPTLPPLPQPPVMETTSDIPQDITPAYTVLQSQITNQFDNESVINTNEDNDNLITEPADVETVEQQIPTANAISNDVSESLGLDMY